MSAVTLESLRADYEAARAIVFQIYEDDQRFIIGPQTPAEFIHSHDHAYHGISNCQYFIIDGYGVTEAYNAAQILDVAEKHGLQAAMMYKLSDGNIDPRKEVSA